MTKIRISCDPYKKETSFATYNAVEDEWVQINLNNNPNSKLLSSKYEQGFFPFVVGDIINDIKTEYGTKDEAIELYFEGTDEDYNDLEKVCTETEKTGELIICKGEKNLNSVDEVQEEIVSVFNDLRDIIELKEYSSNEVKNNLIKFSEATKEIIPLCVIGNVSAGKSTFINSIIGKEILPTGDVPVTSKVFKIIQAQEKDTLSIRLNNHGKLVIYFDEKGYRFEGQGNNDFLIEEINKELETVEKPDLVEYINRALLVINRLEVEKTSDLIEVTVPFNGKVWEETNAKFVILDTPGSNAAANIDHFEILEKAMEGLSNGLVIYVSEYDSLNSNDNMSLFEKVRGMKALDDRFSIIVVNKADENDLPKEGYYSQEKEKEILGIIPKGLYSEGVFFVSSVMGLGAKTNGEFISRHLKKIYRKTEFLFLDKEDEDYTVLYKYNIMPSQLKEKMIKDAEESNESLVLINSGLYSVEREVQNFADNYACYNKCKQSSMYLDNIIEHINKDINKAVDERQGMVQNLTNTLEQEKKELIIEVENKAINESKDYIYEYKIRLNNKSEEIKPTFDSEKIKSIEREIFEQQKEEFDFEDKGDDIKESLEDLKDNLIENVGDLFSDMNKSTLKKLGKTLKDDVKSAVDNVDEWNETRKKVEKEAAKLLWEREKEDYKMFATSAGKRMENYSMDFWNNKAEELRRGLSDIVIGTPALAEDKKITLSKIILDYKEIAFDSFSDISAEVDDFVKKIKVGNVKWLSAEKMDVRKAVNFYNVKFEEFTDNAKEEISKNHRNAFREWKNNLLTTIVENIVDINDNLSETQQKINVENEIIEKLNKHMQAIRVGKKRIDNMMAWQE